MRAMPLLPQGADADAGQRDARRNQRREDSHPARPCGGRPARRPPGPAPGRSTAAATRARPATARDEHRQQRLQAHQHRDRPGRHAVGERDEHAAEVEAVHQPPGEGRMRDLAPRMRPRRAGEDREQADQPGDENETIEQETERRRVGQPVLRGDEAGAPEQHEQQGKRPRAGRRAGRNARPRHLGCRRRAQPFAFDLPLPRALPSPFALVFALSLCPDLPLVLGLGGRGGGLRGAALRALEPRNAFDDLALRLLGLDPDTHANPLAGLEVLVVLEEMGDLTRRDFRQVARRLHVVVEAGELVDRHRQDLGVAPGLVVELQHADGPAADHDAGDERHRGEHQHVAGIAVVRQRLRHVAVIAG